jgi:hypothetical protein
MMEGRDSPKPFARSDAEKEAHLQRARARFLAANTQCARRPRPRWWSALRAWQWLVLMLVLVALLF